MMFDMDPMGPLWWTIGLVVLALLGAACLVSLAHLRPSRPRFVAPPEDAPVQLLRHRLANGEIDDEDYLRRRSAMGDS